MLNSNKITEKLEKNVILRGDQNISIFENWLISYIWFMKMSNLIKFNRNICILEDFAAIYFFAFYKGLTWNYEFFSDQVTKKMRKKFLDIILP